MKSKYIIINALLITMLSSCSLNEYNPSGGPTVSESWSTPSGYEKLINGCYFSLGSNYYGGEDYTLYWAETGTDIWMQASKGWMPESFLYSPLTSGANTLCEPWQACYEAINLCNAAINRIDNVGYTDEVQKNAKVAEAHFIRAFCNFFIVEQWGGVYLPTTETTSALTDIPKSSVANFYDLIFKDLKFCMQYLPYNQTDIGRATRGAAYHLYAKACLQRASYYGEDQSISAEDEKNLLTEAKNTSEYLINNQTTFGVSLYKEPSDIFLPKNNKDNAEAIWKVTHSTNSALNQKGSKYWNRTYKQFGCIQQNMCGCDINIDSLPRFERRIMPTSFLLNLYGDNDMRYDAFFREKYYANESKYTWTEGDANRFGKGTTTVGTNIPKGSLAMWFTRQNVTDDVKKSAKYAIVDVNMIYNIDGTTNSTYYNYYPCLKKFEAPGMYTGDLKKSFTYADNIVFRLAETYLLAAEADFRLGDSQTAANWINVIRNRACKNHDHSMDIKASDVNWDFILDERARELCGEHTRWIDLKRARLLGERIKEHNPEITSFNSKIDYLRPVPDKVELNYQTDPSSFQNSGY